jgi:hypothetical protein
MSSLVENLGFSRGGAGLLLYLEADRIRRWPFMLSPNTRTSTTKPVYATISNDVCDLQGSLIVHRNIMAGFINSPGPDICACYYYVSTKGLEANIYEAERVVFAVYMSPRLKEKEKERKKKKPTRGMKMLIDLSFFLGCSIGPPRPLLLRSFVVKTRMLQHATTARIDVTLAQAQQPVTLSQNPQLY